MHSGYIIDLRDTSATPYLSFEDRDCNGLGYQRPP